MECKERLKEKFSEYHNVGGDFLAFCVTHNFKGEFTILQFMTAYSDFLASKYLGVTFPKLTMSIMKGELEDK